jgi:hypothetical protein
MVEDVRQQHDAPEIDSGGELSWQVNTGARRARALTQRDRHNRSARGILIPAMLPRYRTRREAFDELVLQEVRNLASSYPDLMKISFAVEDVPPSDPAPWESSAVVLGRGFGADRSRGLPDQVVVYRRPLEQRARNLVELREIIHAVVLEEAAQLLNVLPENIDPNWFN